MNVSISYYTARGSRDQNEDAVSILEGKHGLLALVADGLGGLRRGEEASSRAVQTLNHCLQDAAPSRKGLEEAICQAHEEIRALQTTGGRSATTLAALWLDKLCFAAHVGDSRIYQLRDGQILYQSTDHSVAQMAVLAGEITPDQIRTSPERNRLIRVLGNENCPRIDLVSLEVQPGDRLILCSDGFWNPVTEEDMLRTAAGSEDARQWLQAMREIIDQANDPQQDNHTAIVLVVHHE